MSNGTSWPPQWLVHPLSREDRAVRHFDRASDLAAILDAVAGSNETMAGFIFAGLIRGAPNGTRRIVIRLLRDADALRGAPRTRH